MYKVFQVVESKRPSEDRWEIFWCPSAPIHFNDRVSYNGKKYTTRAAAYRKVKQLNNAIEKKPEKEEDPVACQA